MAEAAQEAAGGGWEAGACPDGPAARGDGGAAPHLSGDVWLDGAGVLDEALHLLHRVRRVERHTLALMHAAGRAGAGRGRTSEREGGRLVGCHVWCWVTRGGSPQAGRLPVQAQRRAVQSAPPHPPRPAGPAGPSPPPPEDVLRYLLVQVCVWFVNHDVQQVKAAGARRAGGAGRQARYGRHACGHAGSSGGAVWAADLAPAPHSPDSRPSAASATHHAPHTHHHATCIATTTMRPRARSPTHPP